VLAPERIAFWTANDMLPDRTCPFFIAQPHGWQVTRQPIDLKSAWTRQTGRRSSRTREGFQRKSRSAVRVSPGTKCALCAPVIGRSGGPRSVVAAFVAGGWTAIHVDWTAIHENTTGRDRSASPHRPPFGCSRRLR